jgi:cell wall-associated NlpC family hydrolase
MTRLRRRSAPAVLLGLAASLLVAGSATAEPAAITSKRAEAQRVLEEVHQIDMQVERAAEAYNLATIKLDRIAGRQRDNARRLTIARSNFGRAQKTLQARLVALYTSSSDQDGGTLEVLLGATSFDDFLGRLETVDRVADQDVEVLKQVRAFRGQMARQKAELATARRTQDEVVDARAAYKRQIEGQLAERQRLLSSIRSEIQRMEAAERARQAELERQARARLEAQQRAQELAAAQARAAASTASQPVTDPVGISAETPEVAVAPPSRYGGVIGIAMQYLGVPYVWGGASPSGFDCSGFVMYVFAQVGVSLPHYTVSQFGMGTPVSRSQLQAGDLVFFGGLGHVGIYIGGDSFIHSPHTGDVVKISSMSSGWYASSFDGGRRL